jgi:hypothetical protein
MNIITLTAILLISLTSLVASEDTSFLQDLQFKNPPCEAIYAECR